MKTKELWKVVKKANEVLNNGGTILYPTDTVWGVGCDATNMNAIKKIYSIKNRNKKKPLILLMNNVNLLLNYIECIPEVAHKIITTTKQPTTIIYNNPINLPNILIQNNSIAVRLVDHGNLNTLLSFFKKPITSTSANISGEKIGHSLLEIDESIKQKVDYIIPETFETPKKIYKTSRIIKINRNSSISVIRE